MECLQRLFSMSKHLINNASSNNDRIRLFFRNLFNKPQTCNLSIEKSKSQNGHCCMNKEKTNSINDFNSQLNDLDDLNEKKLLQTSKVFYKRQANTSKSASLSLQSVVLILIGVLLGFFIATWLRNRLLNCSDGMCCSSGIFYQDILISENSAGDDTNANKNENNIKVYEEVEAEKSLVFIGVMTAQKYLDTRANAVYNSWGKNIPGKMSFFSRAGSTCESDIPLVSLPGVDDAYPPQKKSFMMLKFMHDNYLEKFEWFMRVDDDVYIKSEKLEQFLRSINSTVPQFIGQAGLGNKDEFGLLSLDYDENFCMGGPGIAMSRETLRRVVPHISYCLKNLYSTHEDVEIGRCVRKFANVSCTWSYEMQHIFHHNSSGNEAFTGDLLSREVLRATSLHPIKKAKYQYRLHNFFNQRKIMDLRQRYLELRRDAFKLKTDLAKTLPPGQKFVQHFIKNQNLSHENVPNRFYLPPTLNLTKVASKRQDRHDYDFFTRSLFSSVYISPKRGLEGFWKRSIVDNIRQIMDEINKNSIERGRLIDFKDILYGYVKHDPLVGLDYIIDILLVYRKYEGRKMTVPVRRHAYVRNTFTTLLFREDSLHSSIFIQVPDKYKLKNNVFNAESGNTSPNNRLVKRLIDFFLPPFDSNKTSLNEEVVLNNDEKLSINPYKENFSINEKITCKTINFVVPLNGRFETFQRFMKNYKEVVLKTGDNSRLVVVLFELESETVYENLRESDLIRKLLDELSREYKVKPGGLRLLVERRSFSRSIGCEVGAAQFADNDLIFFVDVDMMFTGEFLLRARLNTIEFKQVYYPIVFSEYDPGELMESIRLMSNVTLPNGRRKATEKKGHFDFNVDDGYWRQFGFGILLTYYGDLKRVGGFDKSIVGWGKEDVDLYEKFIASNLTLFRAVDPGLTHVFHRIECDANLASEQMVMCVGSKATSIASQRVLARFVFDKKTYLIEPKLNMNLTSKTTLTTTKTTTTKKSSSTKKSNEQKNSKKEKLNVDNKI